MRAWVAVRDGQTRCGTVAAGRVVADGDPMLDGADPDLFDQLELDPDSVVTRRRRTRQ